METASLDLNTKFGKINFKFLDGTRLEARLFNGRLLYFGKTKDIIFYHFDMMFTETEDHDFRCDSYAQYSVHLFNDRGDGGNRKRRTGSIKRKQELLIALTPLANWIAATYPDLRGAGHANSFNARIHQQRSTVDYHQKSLAQANERLRELIVDQVKSMGMYSN